MVTNMMSWSRAPNDEWLRILTSLAVEAVHAPREVRSVFLVLFVLSRSNGVNVLDDVKTSRSIGPVM